MVSTRRSSKRSRENLSSMAPNDTNTEGMLVRGNCTEKTNAKSRSRKRSLVYSPGSEIVRSQSRLSRRRATRDSNKASLNMKSDEESPQKKMKMSKKGRGEQQKSRIKATNSNRRRTGGSEESLAVAGCSKFIDDLSHSSSDSDDEWLDVEDAEVENETVEGSSSDHGIEVTIVNAKQEESEESKAAKYLRLEVNRRIKERRLKCHRVHLLCYIGHLRFWVRSLVRNEFLKPLCLSLIPSGYSTAALHSFDVSLAERFLNWLTSVFISSKNTYPVTKVSSSAKMERLEKLINDKVYEDDRDFALITFLFFLALNQSVRLVMSCHPLSFKVNIEHLINPRSNVSAVISDAKLRCLVDSKDDKGVRKGATKGLKKNTSRKLAKKDSKENAVLKRNYWIEFWDETTEHWICVDPWTKTVDRPAVIEKHATTPVHYVIAVDDEFGVRDVTARYSSKYLYNEIRHLRADKQWWDATIKLFRSKKRSRNRLEDIAIHDYLMSQPMPTSIADFKNHPLYVLKKDLLKFEAIYPPDQPPVGRIRNVDVYPRSCVYHLDGAANWIKKARSIKPGEQPYKIVKARPDIRIPKEERPTDKTLDLYGYWQTEAFVPPKVINGRIPRNEHGNLYLYKKSMLPEGCAYVQLDGIYCLARRLNIECVPCVVGWEFHKNGNHPIIDGCAVLKEDEAKLRQAWSQEFEKKAIRARQRCRDRAKKNWRRLYRGVILMKKMKEKFSGDDRRLMNVDEQFEASANVEQADDPTLFSWPRADFNLPLTERTDDDE